jgi:hypothetical protein
MLVLRRARRYLQLPDEAVASTGGGGTWGHQYAATLFSSQNVAAVAHAL